MAGTLRALPTPQWHAATVGGSRVTWLDIGSGDPFVFLHGWGLTPRVYAPALARLCAAGIRVIAPALPGVSETDPLPFRRVSMDAFADRMAAFIESLDLGRPVFLSGHSLGGGVAIRLASARPELVRSLTLVNTVGGSPGRARRGDAPLTHRPWWQWAIGAMGEVDVRELPALLPGVVRDFVPSAIRRPVSTLLAGWTAVTADLADEAQELVDLGMPVLFVWGDRDRLVTPGAFSAVETSLPAEYVRGRHGWLLSSHEEFAHLLHNALVVHALLERRRRGSAVLPSGAIALPGAKLSDLFPPERRQVARHQPYDVASRTEV